MHTKKGVSPAPEDKMQTCCFVISRSPVRVREVAPPGPLTGAGYDLPQSTRDHTRAAPASAPHHDDLTGLGGMCPCPVSQAVRHYLDDIRKSMARVCEVAGVSPRLRRHALRHSFGTALAEAGMTAEEIAAWLGHQSPATAARYTHLTAPTMRRHAARVGAALRGDS